MILLDCRKIKEEYYDILKEEVSKIDKKINLTVIQVGNDPASNIYIKQKEKMSSYIGYGFNHIKLDGNIEEQELLNIIDKLNNDINIDAILVQLPLPKHIDSNKVKNKIDPSKDVDGLTDINIGKLAHNNPYLIPCTPKGIMKLLEYNNIDLCSKNVTIVGRSDLVGKPLSLLMTNKDATVTLCHSKTKNLSNHTKNADILVVAIGNPKFITKEYIKENTIVIDVGINRLEDGTICGDVDFDNVKDIVSYITPVPYGVGQMTMLGLASNILDTYKLKEDLK